MPEVGNLSIRIDSNAQEATTGLASVATALERIKKAVPDNGFGLSSVGKELNQFAKQIAQTKSSMSVFKTIAEFGDGMKKLASVSNINFNADKVVSGITALKAAIGDGLHLGQAGTQMKNLRDALTGNWDSTGSKTAVSSLSELATVAGRLASNNAASEIKKVSEALKEYSGAVQDASKYTGGAHDLYAQLANMYGSGSDVKATTDNIKDAVKNPEGASLLEEVERDASNYSWDQMMRFGIWSTSAPRSGSGRQRPNMDEVAQRPILQQWENLENYERSVEAFFGRSAGTGASSDIPAAKSLDGLLEKTTETADEVKSECTDMTETVSKTDFDFSNFDPSKLPLGALGAEMSDTTAEIIKFGAMAKDSFSQYGTVAKDSIDQMDNASEDNLPALINMEDTWERICANIAAAEEAARKYNEAILQSTIESNQRMAQKYAPFQKQTLEDYYYGFRYGRDENGQDYKYYQKDLMSEWLQGNGTKGEQKYAYLQMSREFGMSVDEVKAKVAELREQAATTQDYFDSLAGSIVYASQQMSSVGEQSQPLLGLPAPTETYGDALRGLPESTIELTPDEYSISIPFEGVEQQVEMAKEQINSEPIQVQVEDSSIEPTVEKLEALTDAEAEAAAATRDLRKAGEETSHMGLGLKETFSGLMDVLKTSILGKVAKQFWNIGKRMAIRAIIKQVSAAFSEGVENVYRYSQATGTSLAPAMDSAATSLLTMKNSIGAALSPAIQAIIPYLNQLVSSFINIINYVNQFFAILNGQNTWTKAVETQTKAYDDNTAAAKKASDSSKDLLADWDELNVIQSSSSSSSGSTSTATDYSSMFEEVSTFDSEIKEIAEYVKTAISFVKDHILEVWAVIKMIKTAVKLMKFSNAFSGVIGNLLALAAGAWIMKLTVDVATSLNDKFIDTGEEGWLVASFLTTALGATLAGKVISKVMGAGTGLVAAGITFALTAGATFAQASDIEDQAKKSKLDILAISEAGIGAILSTAGLLTAGFSVATAVGGGILISGLTALIMYEVAMEAKAKEEATAAAKRAFSGADDKGSGKIDPDAYLKALQTRLDELTVNAKLVIDAYVEVPDLKKNYDSVIEQLKGLEAVIMSDDSLTEDDAESFSKAWGTVMDTLKKMDESTYETLLTGLNSALGRAVGEAKEKLLELRKEFVKFHEDMDDRNAGYYLEMEELLDRITQNNYENEQAKQSDIERYTQLSKYFQNKDDRETLKSIDDAIKEGAKLDFTNGSDSVEAAKEYLKSVNDKITETESTFDQAVDAINDSYAYQLAQLKSELDSGLITQEQFDSGKSILDAVLAENLKVIEEDRNNAKAKINEAYELLFKTMFERNNGTQSYWNEVIKPLLETAKKNGAKIPEEYAKYFTEGIKGSVIEFDTDVVADKVASNASMSPEEIAEQINKAILGELEDSPTTIVEGIKSLFGGSTSAYNDVIDIAKLVGFTGFDILGEEMQKQTADKIREIYGDKGDKILEALGYNFELDIPVNIQPKPSNFLEEAEWQMKDLFPNSNVDLLNRPKVTLDDGSIATLLTETYSASANGEEGLQWNQDLVMNLTPILPDGTKLTDDDLDQYVEDLLGKSTNIDELFWNDKVENGGKGLLMYADVDFPSLDKGIEKATQLAEKLHEIQEIYYGLDGVTPTSGAAGIPNLAGTRAANFTVSDVGNGSTNYIRNRPSETGAAGESVVRTAPADPTQEANNIEDGTRSLASTLSSILTLVEKLNNKEWTINVNPSSGWGLFNDRSNVAKQKVTG